MRSLCLVALLTLAAAPATAQTRFVHDTLGPDAPTGLTCGFCADERFGVVFRELPAPRRGLNASDFPIVIDTVEIGLAAAGVSGGACQPSTTGGTVDVALEIWVGSTPPTGDISAAPLLDGWTEGETLVFATDAAPVTLSTADAEGRYEIAFNALEIRDESEQPIRVESGSYVRVVVTLPEGTPDSSDICEPTYVSPGGFPVRDDDGRVAPERSFIYAAGRGFLWNEQVGLNGDWGLRIGLFLEGSPEEDAGAGDADAGGEDLDAAVRADAGAAGSDAGPGGDDGGGCGCRAAARSGPLSGAWLLAALALWTRRRLRGPRRLG